LGKYSCSFSCFSSFAVQLLEIYKKKEEIKKEKKQLTDFLIQIYPVKRLQPANFVGGYKAKNFTNYLPLQIDKDIKIALDNEENVIIIGRPGIGKSHTAVHHILSYRRRFFRWYLLIPQKSAIQNLQIIRLSKRRRYILLFDDLDDYIAQLDRGESILDLVRHLRPQSKKLITIATVRSTAPHLGTLKKDIQLLGKWKEFSLPDWDEKQGKILADRTKVGMSQWDGTPLSVKQPSNMMALEYETAQPSAKAILRSLKILREYGIKPCSMVVLREVYESKLFDNPPKSFEHNFNYIYKKGFLKNYPDPIMAYDPYLDSMIDWTHGYTEYRTLVNMLSNNERLEELLAVGAKCYSEENYVEAEKIYNKCCNIDLESERCHYRLGVVLARQKRFLEAADCFRKATKLQPGWSTAWYRLSNVLRKSGDEQGGYIAFTTARSLEFQDSSAELISRAIMLQASGMEEEALDLIGTIPENIWDNEAAFCKGRILQKLKRFDEACTSYKEAIELDPKIAKTYSYYGGTLLSLHQFGAAKEAYQKAIELDSQMAEAHFGLGLVYRETGVYVKAEEAYQKAIELAPDNASTLSNLGHMLYEENRPDEAEEAFRKAIELSPDNASTLSNLGRILYEKNRFDEAKEAQLQAIKLDTQLAEAHFGLGLVYRETGNLARAEEAFRKAIELDSGNASFYQSLGGLFALQKRFDEAKETFRKAIKLDSQLAGPHFGLGMVYSKTGDFANEEIEFRKAIELDPDNAQSIFILGRILSKQNRFDEAEEAFRKALELDPDNASTLSNLGSILFKQNRFEEAKEAHLQAIKHDSQMAHAHFGLGLVYRETGDLINAVNAFRKSIELKPNFNFAKRYLEDTLNKL